MAVSGLDMHSMAQSTAKKAGSVTKLQQNEVKLKYP